MKKLFENRAAIILMIGILFIFFLVLSGNTELAIGLTLGMIVGILF